MYRERSRRPRTNEYYIEKGQDDQGLMRLEIDMCTSYNVCS